MTKRHEKKQALVPSWHGVYSKKEFQNAFVIALAGFAQAGKTTIADTIVQELRQNPDAPTSFRFSFATRIKEVLATLVGKDVALDHLLVKKQLFYAASPWSVRNFMMLFGTEFVRKQVGDNFWVDVVAKHLALLPESSIVVIDDLRFANEVDLVQALGVAVLIQRPGVDQVIQHSSEEPHKLGLKNVVYNDSTPEVAAQKILALSQKHRDWPLK